MLTDFEHVCLLDREWPTTSKTARLTLGGHSSLANINNFKRRLHAGKHTGEPTLRPPLLRHSGANGTKAARKVGLGLVGERVSALPEAPCLAGVQFSNSGSGRQAS